MYAKYLTYLIVPYFIQFSRDYNGRLNLEFFEWKKL